VVDSAGALRARYDYEVYGKRLKVRGDLDVDAGYTGHWQHAVSGLALAWLRAYDPTTGRWLSRDPIEPWKFYKYVSSNPINLVDSLGGPEHHPYPLYLGGTDNQNPVWLNDENHRKAHRYFTEKGLCKETPEKSRAKWKAMTPAERLSVIHGSLEAAGLSQAEIQKAMEGADFKNAVPGKNNRLERHKGTFDSKCRPRINGALNGLNIFMFFLNPTGFAEDFWDPDGSLREFLEEQEYWRNIA
jgi:RHS repeat-associated protein